MIPYGYHRIGVYLGKRPQQVKGPGVTDHGLDSGPGEDGSVDEGTLNLVCRDEYSFAR